LAVDYFTLVIFSFAFLILAVLPISNATPGMTQLTETHCLDPPSGLRFRQRKTGLGERQRSGLS
jgi:hypothetical protein